MPAPCPSQRAQVSRVANATEFPSIVQVQRPRVGGDGLTEAALDRPRRMKAGAQQKAGEAGTSGRSSTKSLRRKWRASPTRICALLEFEKTAEGRLTTAWSNDAYTDAKVRPPGAC